MEEGKLDASLLSTLTYWNFLPKLSKGIFHKIINILLAKKEENHISVALDLYISYYGANSAEGRKKTLPRN